MAALEAEPDNIISWLISNQIIQDFQECISKKTGAVSEGGIHLTKSWYLQYSMTSASVTDFTVSKDSSDITEGFKEKPDEQTWGTVWENSRRMARIIANMFKWLTDGVEKYIYHTNNTLV